MRAQGFECAEVFGLHLAFDGDSDAESAAKFSRPVRQIAFQLQQSRHWFDRLIGAEAMIRDGLDFGKWDVHAIAADWLKQNMRSIDGANDAREVAGVAQMERNGRKRNRFAERAEFRPARPLFQ